jgi:DNA-directed RNA polymerase II subunit RPB3
MSFISNLKINNDFISFDLSNKSQKIKISLANAIRRTIISDIYTYTINDDTVVFFENSSVLNNEFLKHRLKLIPIVSNLNNVNYDNLIISCKKNNDNENIENIYVSDFICKDSISNELIDINLICKYPDILFAKLKNNQELSFESKLIKNNSYHGGSFFSPVSTCVYKFKIDDKSANKIVENMDENDKRKFMTQDIERVYEKNNIGEPNNYEFLIESNGFYEPKTIVSFGLESLLERLNNLKYEFTNKTPKENQTIFKPTRHQTNIRTKLR